LASDEEMVEGTIDSRLPLLSVMHSVEVSSRAGNQGEKSPKGVVLRIDLDRICCNNQMTIAIEYLDCYRLQQLEVPVNDGACRPHRLQRPMLTVALGHHTSQRSFHPQEQNRWQQQSQGWHFDVA